MTGSSTATVSAGPMPGSTPTAVPSVTPTSAHTRFASVSALAKPTPQRVERAHQRGSQSSSRREHAGRQRQLQHASEQEVGADRDARRAHAASRTGWRASNARAMNQNSSADGDDEARALGEQQIEDAPTPIRASGRQSSWRGSARARCARAAR